MSQPGPARGTRWIWVDGELLPWERATVHVMGQSVQRGSLVFDVMSCHWPEEGPAVFGLREHVDRFINSARLSGMKLALDAKGLIEAIGVAVRANPGAKSVKVSGYYPTPSLDVLPLDETASIAIAVFSPTDIDPSYRSHDSPARLQIADPRKMPDWVQSPQAKLAAGYLYTSIAKGIARKAGFDDVLLLDQDGNLAESSTQSFFWVIDGVIHTASLDVVLAGITRHVVIELARDQGYEVREARCPRASLAQCDEVFLTGTTSNVWAVGQIDDHVWEQAPGPVSLTLANRLETMLAGKDPKFSPIWLQPV